jgi:hypothetical protein
MNRYPNLTFHAADLDLPAAVAALRKYGCILLKGGLPGPVLHTLAPRSEAAFTRWDDQRAAGTLPPAYQAYYVANYLPSSELIQPGENPWFMYELFAASLLPEILRSYFQGHFLFSWIHTVTRRQAPALPQYFTQFHQDGYFFDPSWTVIHCWAPLMPCGIDAPSLEFIPAGLTDIRPSDHKPFRGEHFYDNKDLSMEEEILPHFPADTWWPLVFEPGDLVLYDNFALHRTYVLPQMTQARYNVEIRFIPDRDLPPGVPRKQFTRV